MSYFARSFRFRSFSSLPGAAVLAVAAIVLTGCEVTETGGNGYNPGSGPVCPMIYEPVCAESRGQQRTFPNACQARAEDWRVVASGQCRAGDRSEFRRDRDDRPRDFRRDRNDGSRDFRDRRRVRADQPEFERPRFDNRPGRNTPVRPAGPQTPVYQSPLAPGGACAQGTQQVCGQAGARTRIYMNRCDLQSAGAVEVPASRCRRGNR